MKRLKQKLNSDHGVSLVLALMVFITCAMVGVAVLTAVSASAGRYSYTDKEQQDYLAVSSAARMIEEGLQKSSYHVKCSLVKTEVVDIAGQGAGNAAVSYSFYWGDAPSVVDQTKYRGMWTGVAELEKLFGEDCWNLFLANGIPAEWRNYKVSKTSDDWLPIAAAGEVKSHNVTITLSDHDDVPTVRSVMSLQTSSGNLGSLAGEFWIGADKASAVQPISLSVHSVWPTYEAVSTTHRDEVHDTADGITTTTTTTTIDWTLTWTLANYTRGINTSTESGIPEGEGESE